MKPCKVFAAGISGFLFTAGICSCSASDLQPHNDNSDLSSFQAENGDNSSESVISSMQNGSQTDDITVNDNYTINPLDDGSEKELVFLSYAFSDEKTSAEFSLFEEMGGEIKYVKCGENELYDFLAVRRSASEQIDITEFDNALAYPYACINGIFQPIDSVADFKSELWEDAADTAELFELNGWHYVAPCAILPDTLFYYSRKTFDELDLEDPYELYCAGKWNWDVWEKMIREYADMQEEKFGIGGDYERSIFISVGRTAINFDSDSESFLNNLFDPQLARAADLLYTFKADNVCWDKRLSDTEDFPNDKLLFYAAGVDFFSERSDDIAAVPPPSDTQSAERYWQAKIDSYMWVSGSEKTDAFRCLLECARQTGKERSASFADMTDGTAVYDYSNGISPRLIYADQNENFGRGVIPLIYSAPYENGEWDSICGYFANVVTAELSALNNGYRESVYN